MTEPIEPSYTPGPTQVYTAPPTGEPGKQGFAIASLVIGIVNLCAWIIPICGGPLAIVGIILGVLGLKSTQRGLAIAGIVLGGITLLLAIINSIIGIMALPMLENFNFNQYTP